MKLTSTVLVCDGNGVSWFTVDGVRKDRLEACFWSSQLSLFYGVLFHSIITPSLHYWLLTDETNEVKVCSYEACGMKETGLAWPGL